VGATFIHSLFHLDAPSVTLVVRTFGSRRDLPQHTYLPPGLALDNSHKDAVLASQVRYLRMLFGINHESALPTFEEHLRSSDLHSAYRLLEGIADILANRGVWKRALDSVSQAHGRYGDLIAAAFSEATRRNAIVALRRSIRAPDVRFFLGVLLNVPNPEYAEHLIAVAYPNDEPRRLVAEWVARLLSADRDSRPDTALIDVVRFALDDPSEEYVATRLQDMYEEADVLDHRAVIAATCQAMRRDPLLKTITKSYRR
jgi:hypothetical protein